MTIKRIQPDKNKLNEIVSEARRNQELREQSYRGQALKLYPWICGRCAREFTHKTVAELTVHHCHDNEHSRYEETRFGNSAPSSKSNSPSVTHNPFANLKDLLGNKK